MKTRASLVLFLGVPLLAGCATDSRVSLAPPPPAFIPPQDEVFLDLPANDGELPIISDIFDREIAAAGIQPAAGESAAAALPAAAPDCKSFRIDFSAPDPLAYEMGAARLGLNFRSGKAAPDFAQVTARLTFRLPDGANDTSFCTHP